jgi:hypothetical protein
MVLVALCRPCVFGCEGLIGAPVPEGVGSRKDLAIGNGFSVSSVPSFDSLLQSGMPDFCAMGLEIARAATLFINGLQLVKSLSGKENSSLASDKSYEELVGTVLGVSALITGSRRAVETLRSALESAGQ